MRPVKGPKTQDDANKLAAHVQKHWREQYMDRQEIIGREAAAAEEQNIALHFSGAEVSVEKLAKTIKSSSKSKRGEDGKKRD